MTNPSLWRYSNIGKTKHFFETKEAERTICGLSAHWNGPWYFDLETLKELPKCKHCSKLKVSKNE